MLISCSICKELFHLQSDVCGIRCGHVYHESCLKKWQERSVSCPQCRAKIRDKPFRIYFTEEDTSGIDADLDETALRQKIASMREDLDEIKRKNKQLEEENIRVNEVVATYVQKELTAESTINALKQRVTHLTDQIKDLKPLCEANESLKHKLKSFSDLEKLLQGTESEVQSLVSNTPVTALAVHQLCMYVGVLKRQLITTEEKYKTENERLMLNCKATKQKLMDLKHKCETKVETSAKRRYKNHNTASGALKKDILNIPHVIRSPAESRIPLPLSRPSISDAAFEPPVKKKALACKKVINNLEKAVKKDIPSDPDEVLIYQGPSQNKLHAGGLENKGLFKKLVAPEKGPSAMNGRTDVAYDVWGRSVRNVLAASSSTGERNRFKSLNKKLR